MDSPTRALPPGRITGTMTDDTAFDPLQPEVLCNPYAAYARLRDAGRLLWHARLNAWLVPHYRDCVAAFGNPQLFAADPRRAGVSLPDSSINIQTMDPPEHTRVRELLAEAFRFCSMKDIEHGASALAARLAERIAQRGGGDVMLDFAMPLAGGAICDFLGVPSPDLEHLAPISDAIIEGMDAGLAPARREPAQRAREQLSALVGSWIGDSRPDSLLAFLDRRRGELPDFVLHNSLRVIFHAGYTSVYSAIGSAAHTILREHLPWRAFADPASAALAVEELLRFDGPVQVNSRVALDDASFAGGRVRRGDVLLLLLGSANRDPDGFARPDEIDLHRQPNKHLAFGHGIHQCLGAALARRILRIGLTRLTESLPDLVLAGAALHKPQATQRCLHRLPVACAGPRTAAASGIA